MGVLGMQLRVEKADGGSEVFLHTKVLGTIAAALADSGSYQDGNPEQLAEAVTTFLRRRYGNTSVSSDEIHSMIEVVLTDTGHEEAALALHEHRVDRQIKRRRLEVVHIETTERGGNHSKIKYLSADYTVQPWNKSKIVRDLEGESELPHNLAQAIASCVEEKALGLGCRRITSTLVRELVGNEMLAMRQAESALAEQLVEEKHALEDIRQELPRSNRKKVSSEVAVVAAN
jgi:ATP cone domain